MIAEPPAQYRENTAMRKSKTKVEEAPEFQSAISQVERSGLKLVPAKKSRGKRATMHDYATMDFEPLAGPPLTDFVPPWDLFGLNCRIAYGMCLKTRGELMAMHGTTEHESIDAALAGLLQTGEDLKHLVQTCEMAYARILASAAAADKAGIKFKFADKPAQPSESKAAA
jgi:hypothetical protein